MIYSLLCASFDRLANHKLCAYQFGNDPSHCLLHDNVTCPLDKQQDQILGKIKGYIAW